MDVIKFVDVAGMIKKTNEELQILHEKEEKENDNDNERKTERQD